MTETINETFCVVENRHLSRKVTVFHYATIRDFSRKVSIYLINLRGESVWWGSGVGLVGGWVRRDRWKEV